MPKLFKASENESKSHDKTKNEFGMNIQTSCTLVLVMYLPKISKQLKSSLKMFFRQKCSHLNA